MLVLRHSARLMLVCRSVHQSPVNENHHHSALNIAVVVLLCALPQVFVYYICMFNNHIYSSYLLARLLCSAGTARLTNYV